MTDIIPPAPVTIPASSLAIDRLATSVENMRAELQAQGALNASRLTAVLDTVARLDATLKILVHEVQSLKRDYHQLSERVTALESHAFRQPVKAKRRASARKR